VAIRLLLAGEKSPGGSLTHWKTPPLHGAHPIKAFTVSILAAGFKTARHYVALFRAKLLINLNTYFSPLCDAFPGDDLRQYGLLFITNALIDINAYVRYCRQLSKAF